MRSCDPEGGHSCGDAAPARFSWRGRGRSIASVYYETSYVRSVVVDTVSSVVGPVEEQLDRNTITNIFWCKSVELITLYCLQYIF